MDREIKKLPLGWRLLMNHEKVLEGDMCFHIEFGGHWTEITNDKVFGLYALDVRKNYVNYEFATNRELIFSEPLNLLNEFK